MSIELQSHGGGAPAGEDPNHMGSVPPSRWLKDCPNPPTIWQELVGAIRANVFSKVKSFKRNKDTNPALYCLQSIFPIIGWGRQYSTSKFKHDLLAGLTLASISIPQSIGYANLAKLDPEYGLYTSVVPPLIYATMGSSREIAIGPVAIVSMLLSSMIQELQDPVTDPLAYQKLVFTVTLFTGAFQAIFGLFRLGFLVDFLSHAALVGFMAGAAVVIGLQQLKGLFGFSNFTNKTDIISVLSSVFDSLHHQWQPLNFVIGGSFLIFILLARYLGKRSKKLFWIPAIAPLISVILSTLIVFLSKADNHGVKIVKHINRGINRPSVNKIQLTGPNLGQIAKIGLVTSVISLTEAIAVGRSFASIKGYQIDGNKEMMAMGVMNIAGSLTSCYVATGSFSRTAVNFSAGCETVVSNIVMSITVMAMLGFMTRLLYYTPMTILASIIISALPGLIDLAGAYHIWKLDKLDFLVCLGAFFGVLFASVEVGLLVAIGISFAKVVLSSIRPGVETLGRLESTDVFCDINQYPMAIKTSAILTLRLSSPMLCFANASFIRFRVLSMIKDEDDHKECKKKKLSVRVVIIDMSCVMSVDTTGLMAIQQLQKELISNNIQLAIAGPRWRVLHKLKKANIEDKMQKDNIFLTVGEAVECYAPSITSSTAYEIC